MSALTKDRNTVRTCVDYETSLPAKAATKIYNGGAVMVVPGTAGAIPAADVAGGKAMGVSYEQVDNSSGATGDLSVPVRVGCFFFDTTAITTANIGALCYFTDDHTVETASTNSVIAGKIEMIDPVNGVLVDMRQKVA